MEKCRLAYLYKLNQQNQAVMNIRLTCFCTRALALLACSTLPCLFLRGQMLFERTGQVFLVLQNTNELVEFSINPSSNSLQFNTLGVLPPTGFYALGFRKTDNFLYGINFGNNHLFKIGKNAVAQDLGSVGLDAVLFYLAGDVSPDGKYMVNIGSNADGQDVHLAKTDLEDANYSTQFVPLGGNGRLADVAFDPYTSLLYGYDAANRCLVRLDVNSGAAVSFPKIDDQNEIFGLYFDAFGDLYAYGRSVYGVVDALFFVDKNTGKETRLATGANAQVADVASCAFSIEMKNTVEPAAVLPCSDVIFSYAVANGSGATLTDVNFEHPLPAGFHFKNFLQNPFGAAMDTVSIPSTLRMQNLTLTPGTKMLSMKIEVGDIPKGKYTSQASLSGLPLLYGVKSLSDNSKTAGFDDAIAVEVNRFEKDTFFFNWFICHGETMTLDATAFGNDVQWNTGDTSAKLPVSKGGLYTLKAGNVCEAVFVSHDVTSASCPYTITLLHEFAPDTLFPCSDVTFRFIIDNDSGEPRANLSFADTLPAGFVFKKILKNPFGGNLTQNAPPNVIGLEGMSLKAGKDTLDLLVEAGDVAPGTHKNRARIYGLPQVMGPIRLSDDPRTFPQDSSTLYVLGTYSDTLFLNEIICKNAEITLNASHLGKNFLWEDGSTSPEFLVKHPGEYHLTLYDGCEPSEVFWNVAEGDRVEVAMPAETFFIHQGEQIQLEPLIINHGDTLVVEWTDPLGNSLSCPDCLHPIASPLRSTTYSVEVFNGVCSDTALIEFQVDDTRRIFAPNAFSPNDDGVDDYFFLQSPDLGVIRTLSVFDRWGNVLFSSKNSIFNEMSSGWDGLSGGKKLPPGVYLWQAEIEFPDGEKGVFAGDVTLFR
jgi:gliding motility-associated-like protein